MAKWSIVNVYLQRLLMYVSFQKLYVTFLLFNGQAQLSGILEVLVLFCDRVSCNLTSPLAGSIVEDDHELLFNCAGIAGVSYHARLGDSY